jgi:hypothetical protein
VSLPFNLHIADCPEIVLQTVDDVLLPENHTRFAPNPLLAEHSRPKREIIEKQRLANPEPRGRPRTHAHAPAKLTNWQSPLLWGTIQEAVKSAGWSPTAIQKWLRRHDGSLFGEIQANVIRRWIVKDSNGKSSWSPATLARAQQGHTPGGQTTRIRKVARAA